MKSFILSLLFFFLSGIIFYSCSHDNPPPQQPPSDKFCWQFTDAQGIPMDTICDKTAAEMAAAYSNSCAYYKYGEKFCWLVNDSVFFRAISEDGVRQTMVCFNHTNNYTAVKISCDYCKKFYHRLKKTYKPDNTFTFSETKVQQFCGDTAQKLFPGRQIIEKETADSLIVRQFSGDGIQW